MKGNGSHMPMHSLWGVQQSTRISETDLNIMGVSQSSSNVIAGIEDG